MRQTALVAVAIAVSIAAAAHAQRPIAPEDTALSLVLDGTGPATAPENIAEPLRSEIGKYIARADAYRSSRHEPSNGSLRMMQRVSAHYERLLVAITDHPQAKQLAVSYVDGLYSCYEWEGISDCPLREARFADAYLKEHSRSPFADYLRLLAAHRWLCAAEFLERERNVTQAAAARQNSAARLAEARRTSNVLLHTAAEQLAIRHTCFAVP